MNGMIIPGIKSEPSINNIFTTDGIKIESKIDKMATMISPFFIKKTGFFLESFFLNLHIMSLPIVMAFTKLIESIVDIIIANNETINNPKNPEGSTFSPSKG